MNGSGMNNGFSMNNIGEGGRSMSSILNTKESYFQSTVSGLWNRERDRRRVEQWYGLPEYPEWKAIQTRNSTHTETDPRNPRKRLCFFQVTDEFERNIGQKRNERRNKESENVKGKKLPETTLTLCLSTEEYSRQFKPYQFAEGYQRIVFGDHGPYIELSNENVLPTAFVFERVKNPNISYYRELYTRVTYEEMQRENHFGGKSRQIGVVSADQIIPPDGRGAPAAFGQTNSTSKQNSIQFQIMDSTTSIGEKDSFDAGFDYTRVAGRFKFLDYAKELDQKPFEKSWMDVSDGNDRFKRKRDGGDALGNAVDAVTDGYKTIGRNVNRSNNDDSIEENSFTSTFPPTILRTLDEPFYVYRQLKDVRNQKNPPRTGKWSTPNERPEGYADYKVGMHYCLAQIEHVMVAIVEVDMAAIVEESGDCRGGDNIRITIMGDNRYTRNLNRVQDAFQNAASVDSSMPDIVMEDAQHGAWKDPGFQVSPAESDAKEVKETKKRRWGKKKDAG